MLTIPKISNSLVDRGDALAATLKQRSKYLNLEMAVVDPSETKEIMSQLDLLAHDVGALNIKNPKSIEEIYLLELEQFCTSSSAILKYDIYEHIPDPEEVIKNIGITTQRIDEIKEWLLNNRSNVISANKENTAEFVYDKKVPLDKTEYEISESSKLVLAFIDKFLSLCDKHFGNYHALTEVLRKYKPLTYFELGANASRDGQVVRFGTKSLCYISQGKVILNVESLLNRIGHEYVGHAQNYYYTEQASLPLFIKENNYSNTVATLESVSQYFETSFIKHLERNPDVLREIIVDEDPAKVLRHVQNTEVIKTYFDYLRYVSIWILATSTRDDIAYQQTEISKYAIEPFYASNFIQKRRNQWNSSTKKLLPNEVGTLKYAVDIVEQLSKKMPDNHRSQFEETVLTGYWSRQGFIEWVNFWMKG